MIEQTEYAARRKRLFAQMKPNSVAVIIAAPEYIRNGDAHFSYRQNSDFYYLTGFSEPDAIAVFIKEKSSSEYILFNRPHDLSKEQWTGFRIGQEDAVKQLKADQAYCIDELEDHFPDLLNNKECLYYAFGRYPSFDRKVNGWINQIRANPRSGINAPDEIINLEKFIHEMRLVKSSAEIEVIKKAAKISAQAQLGAMKSCKPGKHEYDLEAILLYEFKKNGASGASFNPIVGSGRDACILHYESNDKKLQDGDLVLVDAGCEYQNYAGDITRTYPVNGKFTEEQKLIYELVLAAQLKAIEEIKPGNSWRKSQEVATKTITEGLCDLGILKGNVDELIEQEAHKSFYMHNIGHWLGVDVHDVGIYKVSGKWRTLKPGMVLTIEPGIYILPGMKNVAEKWWGIGVRIEDDILVTEDGCQILTSAVPKAVVEIEKIME
jgi:Xaa-Pro aminopeptidase